MHYAAMQRSTEAVNILPVGQNSLSAAADMK